MLPAVVRPFASAVLATALLAGCATGGGAADPFDAQSLAESMAVYQSAPAVAVSGALGSETNPIRVLMPEGERTYLYRLRCGDGSQPAFERRGSGGLGPYRKIVDFYAVDCAATGVKTTLVMDMYHCVEETRAPPGFTIVPEIGDRDRSDCR